MLIIRFQILKFFFSGYKLPRAPGDKFEYSNLGMALVGHILEDQMGKPYEEIIKEEICVPLSMNNTSIILSAQDSLRLAHGYVDREKVPNWDFPSFAGSGAFRSTGNDMVKFLKAQIASDSDSLSSIIKKTQHPLFNIKNDKISKKTDKVGMGWFFATDKDNIIWHNGATGGYRAYMGFNKETKSGVVILSNSNSELDDLFFYLLNEDDVPGL